MADSTIGGLVSALIGLNVDLDNDDYVIWDNSASTIKRITPQDLAHGVNRANRVINVIHYGAVGDGVTDDTAAIQAAIDSGLPVYVPDGTYYLGSTLELNREGVFFGQSCHSTVFTSDINAHIIRTERDGASPYMNRRAYYGHFTIQGDVTAGTGQHGLSLLRFANPSIIEQVEIKECGGNGLQLFEAVGGKIDSLVSIDNVGHGLYTNEGFVSWTDATSTNLPTNAVTFLECKFQNNGGAGIHLLETHHCRFIGGYTQTSYRSFNDDTAELAGWNIYLGAGANGNVWNDHWLEGQCKCHIYCFMGSTNTSLCNMFTNIYHSVGAATSPVERLCIVDKGTVVINGHASNGTAYETTTRAKGTAGPTTHTTLIRIGENDTPAWAISTAYGVGDCVSNGGERYICTIAGTSAVSGGPIGTDIDPDTRDITDNTATWIWDGTEGIGRAALIGVKHTSTATLGNYKQIESQCSNTPALAVQASELLLFDATIAST